MSAGAESEMVPLARRGGQSDEDVPESPREEISFSTDSHGRPIVLGRGSWGHIYLARRWGTQVPSCLGTGWTIQSSTSHISPQLFLSLDACSSHSPRRARLSPVSRRCLTEEAAVMGPAGCFAEVVCR